MKKQLLATIIQEGSRLVSEIMRNPPRRSVQHTSPGRKEVSAPETKSGGLTTEETIQYQRREIGKELLLLGKHLQQGCKIDGKPCDCCEKHPTVIEGLAQETLGMVSDPALTDLIRWVKEIEPITTEAASASGEYDKQYPSLAIKARQFRKAITGKESILALIGKEVKDVETISTTQEATGDQTSVLP